MINSKKVGVKPLLKNIVKLYPLIIRVNNCVRVGVKPL